MQNLTIIGVYIVITTNSDSFERRFFERDGLDKCLACCLSHKNMPTFIEKQAAPLIDALHKDIIELSKQLGYDEVMMRRMKILMARHTVSKESKNVLTSVVSLINLWAGQVDFFLQRSASKSTPLIVLFHLFTK